MKIIPLDHKNPGAWGAMADSCSGFLIFDGSEFKAERSIANFFASMGKGHRGRIGNPRQKNGKLVPWVFLLAAIRSKDMNPDFAKRCRLAHCMELKDGPDIDRLIDDADLFDEYAGAWFVKIARDSEDGLTIAAKWLEGIEDKLREPTAAEADFISALEDAASTCGGVPTQKDVREQWLIKDCDRSIDSFPDVRDSLGFGWLPAAKPTRGRD